MELRSFLLIWLFLLCHESISTEPTTTIPNALQQGCYYARNRTRNKRTCNSDDPPDAVEQGLCRMPSLPYREIRIFAQNWESSVFESWLMQILLSEFLNIPSTIESGDLTAKLSFYDSANEFVFGTFTDLEPIESANLYDGDCSKAPRTPEHYLSCAHVIPEMWDTDAMWIQNMISNGTLEAPKALGPLGLEGWYMPKFTAENDPALLSYFGLSGEQNRRKLAETFLRPTYWEDYCNLISPNNCSTPDTVALRGPQDDEERKRMFVEGVYTGYFRKTDKNDCDKNPTNCTGHIADYPCGWSSYTPGQTFYLHVALEGDGPEPNLGYKYSQLVEIWLAANATRSNVIMKWWQPESLYQRFQGTDLEFTRVYLPPPTQECLDHRNTPEERCSANLSVRIGNPLGICDETARPLQKLMVSASLFTSQVSIDNPAYDAIDQFQIPGTKLDLIFQEYQKASTPREAICNFLIDSFSESMVSFIPQTYPRVSSEGSSNVTLTYVSMLIAILAATLVIWTGGMVLRYREERAVKAAQIEFLMLLLVGSLMITVGATLMAAPPSNGSCVAQVWLVNIGYTFELVPLIVKMAAINRMMNAARRMRRITVTQTSLFGAVIFISFLVAIYLLLWTLLDPPRECAGYELSGEVTSDGEYVVDTNYYCDSASTIWNAFAVGWLVVLLLCTSVIAFQTRNLKSQFNESRSLAIIIYSHFMFVMLRATVDFFLQSLVNASILTRMRSLILSFDVTATMVIYFLPKFWAQPEEETSTMFGNVSSPFGIGLSVAARRTSSDPGRISFLSPSLQFSDRSERSSDPLRANPNGLEMAPHCTCTKSKSVERSVSLQQEPSATCSRTIESDADASARRESQEEGSAIDGNTGPLDADVSNRQKEEKGLHGEEDEGGAHNGDTDRFEADVAPRPASGSYDDDARSEESADRFVSIYTR